MKITAGQLKRLLENIDDDTPILVGVEDGCEDGTWFNSFEIGRPIIHDGKLKKDGNFIFGRGSDVVVCLPIESPEWVYKEYRSRFEKSA